MPKDIDDNVFNQVIDEIDRLETDPERHLSIQIDARMRDAIRAAKASGKDAKVTVEVKVIPGADLRISFAGGVKATLPNPPTNTVTMFADDMGRIHKSDPRQLKIPGTAGPSIVKKEN